MDQFGTWRVHLQWPPWWSWIVALVGGVVLLWLLLALLLWRARRHAVRLRDVVRLLPDLVKLLRGLAGDPAVPRGVRVRLWLLLAYLAMPVDLVLDVIPLFGYADDVLLVALVLRSVTRRAGADALDRHWPGTAEGLAAVRRLAGLAAASSGTPSFGSRPGDQRL